MKAYTALLATETNTFAPFTTVLEDYSVETEGDAGYRAYLTTFEDAATKRDWSIVKGMAAFANPGGKTTTSAYSYLKNLLLEELQVAMPVDAVVLALHGAMVSEDCDDCEGDILAAVREIVGPDIPVGAGLDPHAHLTNKMTESADILTFMKQWPHIDALDVATWAFDLTADVAEGKISKPVMSVYDCRMIGYYHTLSSPVKELVDETISLEAEDDILSISIIHGFEPADVEDMGTKILVITDNQPEKGQQIAKSIGQKLHLMRGHTAPVYLTLKEGIDEVERTKNLPVLVADTSDVTGGGDPGDATFILEELLSRKIDGGLITSLADPQAIKLAIKAGVGATVPLRIGGKTCKASGEPIDVEAQIMGVFLPNSIAETCEENNPDAIVVIKVDGIEIVLRSSRETFMTYQPLLSLGINLESKRVIVVKSANNFYAGHEEIAGSFLYLKTPGAFNPQTAEYKKINRNIWPFVDEPFLTESVD